MKGVAFKIGDDPIVHLAPLSADGLAENFSLCGAGWDASVRPVRAAVTCPRCLATIDAWYKEGVAWIAFYDDSEVIGAIKSIAIVLMASMFDKSYDTVAADVTAYRQKNWSEE